MEKNSKLILSNLLERKKMSDLNKSEYLILVSLAIPILFFGFYPELLFNTIEVSVNDLIAMYYPYLDTSTHT